MNEKKYQQDAIKRKLEIIKEWEEKDQLSDARKLEYIMLDIMPYSRYWRLGIVKALKRAIKLLEKEDKQ